MLKKLLCGIVMVVVYTSGWSMTLQNNGNGTVTDFDTGLIWQQTDENTRMVWVSAFYSCSNLLLAGNSNWRLSNVKELNSIVDYRIQDPAIDRDMFPSTISKPYWTNSTWSVNSDSAWIVDFRNGDVGTEGKTGTGYYVRCVR